MSVVLRCVKCNGVLEEKDFIDPQTNILDHRGLWCPRCNENPGHTKHSVPGSFEDQAIALLTEIRDHLAKLTE